MKLLITALLASLATSTLAQTNPNPVTPVESGTGFYHDEDELQKAWNMDEPEVRYDTDTNVFTLYYNTTDFFKNFEANTHLNEEFYDKECKTGNATTEHVVSDGIFGVDMGVKAKPEKGEMMQDATDDYVLELDFEIETSIVTLDDKIYTDNGDGTGKLELCVRAAVGFNGTDDRDKNLQEQIDAGYREVNFIESLLTINYDLTNDFAITTLNVEPKDKVTTTFQEDAFGIQAWLCNITRTDLDEYKYTPTGGDEVTRSFPFEIDDPSFAFNQGALISVCVRPVDESYDEGIVMDQITDFTWKREGDTPIPVSQEAVKANAAASNLLTYYPGCENADYCRFSSILFADFYITPGVASGSGSARTQFYESSRRLGADNTARGRALQETEAGSVFDLSVGIAANDDGPGALKTAGGASLGFTALASFMAIAGSMLFF